MPIISRVASLPDNFGDALRFLRKRARLTQDELGRAVGYSREQIARLENSSRLPDLAVVAALFVPALLLEREQQLVEQFLTLAGTTRTTQQLTITHTRQTRLQLVSETVLIPDTPLHIPPTPLLPLIGRITDLAKLLTLLQTNRLITIIGAPGIGKTRLALELAHQALPYFTDGAAFISLSDVALASDIPYAVLKTLSITPPAHQSAEEAILTHLAPRNLLLVLDNCEHILEGVARFTYWLAHAPRLKLLCTSRLPLDLYGEQEWTLSPLPVPDLAQPADIVNWAELPAMQLLLARAQAIDPTLTLTHENLLPLATLCVALDGLPLALELAAARLRHLPPQLLVQQLLAMRGNGHLSSTWLQQTKRNIAERHRTLQAAINWSVQLLTPEQQKAFFSLGVFIGGCSEPAAKAITHADTSLLSQLARANLIRYEQERITLLETLRVFAYEQSIATGQLGAYQHRHAQYYTTFAQQLFVGLIGDDQATWMQRALADHENCLTALRWALAENKGEIAIAIAGSLWWFWCRRGLFHLGLQLLSAALQLSTPDLAARATALNGLASIYLAQDDYAASLAYHQEGLTLRHQLNDANGKAVVLHNMGLTAYMMGDYAQAISWLQESITANPDADPMQAWAHIGIIALDMQDRSQAKYWLEKAYAQVMHQPEGWAQAFVMHNLADLLWELGELAIAKEMAQTSLHLFEILGDSYYAPDPQLLLAQIAADEGEYELATALSGLALGQYQARHDQVLIASVLLFQAKLAWKIEDGGRAIELFRQAKRLRQQVKRPMSPREQRRYDEMEQIISN